MTDVREVIAEAIPCNIVYGRPQAADGIISALTAAGIRIMSKEDVKAVRDKALEEAAAYIEGEDGKIPGANAFVTLVSGNRQPCMSGDGRDRLYPHTRRAFDDAALSLASAIRSLKSIP